MSTLRRIEEDLKFIDTCQELNLLDETDAETLRRVVVDEQGFAAQEALRRGLLTPSDVDIIHSLRHPTEVVPEYEILGLVGRGGMGVVYRARQLDLDRIVALKTVLISNVSSPTAAARFEREAKTLARLQHPNIVQALNFGKHQGRYFFAMEYVTGRSCEQALRQQGRLAPAAVWSIVRQVASGLMHALRHNVIHRDIKPANLLLLPAPEGSLPGGGHEVVKITDFGLAMFADGDHESMRLTTGDKIMGSPAYMSPEQFGGDTVDFRADIYSLGATAWHLLFGFPPFRGNNLAALLSQKSQPLEVDPSELPVAIASEQWQLLMRMLEPEEDLRPASYEELIAAIDQFSGHLLPIASPAVVGSESIAISEQPTMEAAASTIRPHTENASKRVTRGADNDSEIPVLTALSQTLEIPAPAQTEAVSSKSGTRSENGRLARRAALVAAGATAAGLVGWAAWKGLVPTRGPRKYTRVIESQPLFDGVTLSGWDVGGSMTGAWNTVEAPDASTSIACMSRQGALTRRVAEKTHPRISLFVWPQAGFDKIDLDFAVQPSSSQDVRGSLRLTYDEILLGTKQTDFGSFESVTPMPAPPTLCDRFHVVHLERQPDDWFVFWEQKLVGTLPIDSIGGGTAIRLVVHPTMNTQVELPLAYFAEVRLDNLDEASS